MFDYILDILHEGRVHQFCILQNAEPLPYADTLNLWQHSEAFRSFFISILEEVPFVAFRWETPPITLATVSRAFEFVILDSPELERPADAIPFARHFAKMDFDDGIVVFENLGKDATLVVPSPRGPESAYSHLASFTRQASPLQNHALWQKVGATVRERIAELPIWLSTAGGGVSWLHVRLDSWPKYYRFRPYGASA